MKRDLIMFLYGGACVWLTNQLPASAPASLPQAVVPPSGDQQVSALGPERFPGRALLDALAFVESSNNPRAVSPAGARGLYQIMPATWGDVMDVPFEQAFDPVSSETAAVRYLEWIRATLTKWKGSADVQDVLAAWHGGIGRYKRRGYNLSRMPESTREFVGRVIRQIRARDN